MYTTFSPSFSPETTSVCVPDCWPTVTVRVSVLPFATTLTVAELPLPSIAAVGMRMTSLARTSTSIRAKPVDFVVTFAGSSSTEMVARPSRPRSS